MDLLEAALRLLPLMWGKGAPAFEGKVITVPEALCYPRPLQEHVPILVGGSGEQRTVKLVAKYADACNLFGDAANVRRKVEVLHRHCADVGRDPADITVTHLSGARVGADREGRVLTVDDHVGRYRELAEAGGQTAVGNLPRPRGATDVAAPAPFRTPNSTPLTTPMMTPSMMAATSRSPNPARGPVRWAAGGACGGTPYASDIRPPRGSRSGTVPTSTSG